MARDWSQLPNDLLTLIGQKVNKLNDLYCFLSVCKSWRETNIHFPQSPWLIFFNSEIETRTNRRQKNENPPLCGLVGLGEQNVHELDLPEPKEIQCVGSTGNFLILKEGDLRITLFNPFSRVATHLPPVESLRFFGKLATRNTDGVVMAIVRKVVSMLLVARPGDTYWTEVRKCVHILHDIILYKNRFYTVNDQGEVTTWDVGLSPKVPIKDMQLSMALRDSLGAEKNYLVEWLGELLLVIKYRMHKNRKRRFKVYQLNSRSLKWNELLNLRNYSLFLGKNTSVSVLASGSIKENCIYYTDDRDFKSDKSWGHDMGVFNMEGNDIQPHYNDSASTNHHSLPVWIIPSSKSEAGIRKRKWSSLLS
ncbi:hypothetical protein ACHQM5_006892 [Ranunculus cassubicifolius]